MRTPAFFRTCLGLLAVSFSGAAFADIPLDPHPAWQSQPSGAYDTGGAWADVDGDGWLDMVVAVGNDMARQNVVVYRNRGDGTLPPTPTWTSADRDYHGHLDIGDVNGDGRPDVAVAVYIGPAGFDEPGYVKVYLNNGAGGFTSSPAWTAGEDFYCFSLAFGDADGDGDLDLACACGDDYYAHPERQRVFFNRDGTLDALPGWLSDETGYALDVVWGDLEGDGDQDLVFCGSSTPMRAYVNNQTQGGGIATTATWHSLDSPQYGNTTALGDWNNDGFPELAVADNNQLGGAGRFKVYANNAGVLSGNPVWQSSNGGYGSHVSWIDLDLDGDLDLASGRWWDPVRIYQNTGVTLETTPIWTSSTDSVIENLFWGDVDRDGERPDGLLVASGDGLRTHFPLGCAPVCSIDEVFVNDVQQPDGYAEHLANGWISLAPPPPTGDGNVVVHYTYSVDVDLGVTNWDASIGNYLFLNTTDAGDAPWQTEEVAFFRVEPNPVLGSALIRYRGAGAERASLVIYDASGRTIRRLHAGPLPGGLIAWLWDRRDERGARVGAGVCFARLQAGTYTETRRLTLLK